MEQRAPQLATASKIFGCLILVATLVNLKLDWLENPGFSIEEYLAISISVGLFLMAYFASKERKIVGLTDNLTLEEQFARLENTPTKSSSMAIINPDQSTHTKSIIDSILGAKAEVNEQQVSQAIGTLTTGDFGQAAQSIAEQLPAPHKHADRVLQSPAANHQEIDISVRHDVPLPEVNLNLNDENGVFELPSSGVTGTIDDGGSIGKNQPLPDLSDLFSDEEGSQNDILIKIEDWKFEERLSKEFESVGFFISDHPLNQFTEIFNDYKITDYSSFISKDDLKDSNIAATLLKVQERKTAKGNSYAVLKLTDLSSVFELFVFSDILELNREILKEGSSLILTLLKNISNDENRLTRINVQKIASLKDLFNSPINEVSFVLNSEDQIKKISKILNDEGKTVFNINLVNEDNVLKFRLKNARKLDRKSLNLLRNQEIRAIIN